MELDDNQVKELFEGGYSNPEIAKKLGVSLSTVKRRLGILGLKRTEEQKRRMQSRILKEGYASGRLKPHGGDKLSEEGRRRIIEYNKSHSKELKAKREATCLKKYGVKNVFESKEFQEKAKRTNIEKYGVPYAMQSEEVARKSSKRLSKSLVEKYRHEEQIKKVKEAFERLGRKLRPKELIETLGLSQSNSYILMHRYELENYVALSENEFEQEIGDFLRENGIEFEKHNRQILRPQEIDLYIPEFKVGIEANDMGSHNSTVNFYHSKPKEPDYHYEKSRRCEEQGIRLVHIWDYEWADERKRPILENIVLSACGKVKTVYARKCKIEARESIELKNFFNKNHIAGHRGGKFAICLVYEGEVVMAYMFGKPYFGRNKYEWEVIRATTKLGYRVVGGASRIWKCFVREYNPESCVFYVDFDYFDGHSLENLGFKYVSCKPTPKNFLPNESRVVGRKFFLSLIHI